MLDIYVTRPKGWLLTKRTKKRPKTITRNSCHGLQEIPRELSTIRWLKKLKQVV